METEEEYERRKARGMAPEDMTWQESQHRVDELRQKIKKGEGDLAIDTAADSLRNLNQTHMTGEEMRKQICDYLLESVPSLKKSVRSYMSQGAVANSDFGMAAKIWKALDGIEDATSKLSQSEF